MTDQPVAIDLAADIGAGLARAARRAMPREMVGLLAGPAGSAAMISLFAPLPNVAIAADRFAVDPVAFATAEAELRRRGLRFRGFAHSHPHGCVTPSPTDRDELWPDCVQVIVAVAADGEVTLAAYRRAAGTWRALELAPGATRPGAACFAAAARRTSAP